MGIYIDTIIKNAKVKDSLLVKYHAIKSTIAKDIILIKIEIINRDNDKALSIERGKVNHYRTNDRGVSSYCEICSCVKRLEIVEFWEEGQKGCSCDRCYVTNC